MTRNRLVREIWSRIQIFVDEWGALDLDPLDNTLEWAAFTHFAVATLLREHNLSYEEIIEICAKDGSRDKAIDAIWMDFSQDPPELHVFQCNETEVYKEDWDRMLDGLVGLLDSIGPTAANNWLNEWSRDFLSEHPSEFTVTFHLVTGRKARGDLQLHEKDEVLLESRRKSIFDIHDIEELDRHLSETQRRYDPIDIDLSVPEDSYFLNTSSNHTRVISALISCEQLARIFDRYGKELFRLNPRYFLSLRSPNNREIRDSILKDPERFHTLNNGLTATAEQMRVDSAHTAGSPTNIHIRDFQIVNGCQTTNVIHRVWNSGTEGGRAVEKAQILIRIVDDDTSDYYNKVSHASNTQTPLKVSDWRSTESVHPRLRNEFNALSTPWFYEYWRGDWNTEWADQSDRRKYLITGSNNQYRMLTTEALAQHGWAFLGSGYKSADQGKRVMEDDALFHRVFPPDTIHCTQLLLSYLIGIKADKVLKDRAISENRKPGHYSAFKFPSITVVAKTLCMLHRQPEEQYLSPDISTALINNLDDWCPNLLKFIADGLISHLDQMIRIDASRGYRALVRRADWVDDSWPAIRSSINLNAEINPDSFLPGLTSAAINKLPA